MGKLVLKSCKILINEVDLSDHASSVEVNYVRDEIETTNFSGSGRERIAGLSDDSIVVTFQQDYGSGEVNATLSPLLRNANEFEVKIRPTDAAISPNNVEYRATCILLEYQPLSGDVGDLSETEVTFPTQRTGIDEVTS